MLGVGLVEGGYRGRTGQLHVRAGHESLGKGRCR